MFVAVGFGVKQQTTMHWWTRGGGGIDRSYTVYMANGKWTCTCMALLQSTDHSKHFTIIATFTHSHTFIHWWMCARRQLHIRSNLGFSVLLKDASTCSSAQPGGAGIRTVQSLDGLLYPLSYSCCIGNNTGWEASAARFVLFFLLRCYVFLCYLALKCCRQGFHSCRHGAQSISEGGASRSQICWDGRMVHC